MRRVFLCFSIALPLAAAGYPPPASGDFLVRDFRFHSGEVLPELKLEFGISIGICFIYLLFMKTSQVFGYNGSLDPFVTAWLANLLFLAAGAVNLIRLRK